MVVMVAPRVLVVSVVVVVVVVVVSAGLLSAKTTRPVFTLASRLHKMADARRGCAAR